MVGIEPAYRSPHKEESPAASERGFLRSKATCAFARALRFRR